MGLRPDRSALAATRIVLTCLWSLEPRSAAVKNATNHPRRAANQKMARGGKHKRAKHGRDGAAASSGGDDGKSAVLEAMDDESGALDADARAKMSATQLSNVQFESYYQQTLHLGEAEFALFLDTVRKPLPSTFRISPLGLQSMRATRQIKQIVEKILQDHFPVKNADGVVVAEKPPSHMAWLPSAWDSGTDRTSLRRIPIYHELHEVLVRFAETGAVARQELVSMLPPLVLDVQPGNRVVDLCASPGSKSLQLLEQLELAAPGRGLLVANDVNSKRAYMLSHRLKPLKSPALVLTTHDAGQFPTMGQGGEGTFDRVLADVPCTGDGTMRKNVMLWQKFSVDDAKTMHPLQLRIALQGFQLLKPGGLMVYSTCSMSPLEDEAVVAELLRVTGEGAAELVDRAAVLAGFRARPGLASWRVPMAAKKEGVTMFDALAAAQTWAAEKGLKGGDLRPSMFAQDDCGSMHLERCMRVLPHDQNTGGFFVACIRKLKPWPSDKPAKPAVPFTGSREPKVTNQNDVWFDDVDEGTWKAVQDAWGLPNEVRRNLQVRRARADDSAAQSGGKIVWINDDCLALLDRVAQVQANVHFVNAGVVVLQRSGKFGSGYRVTHSGASLLLGFVTKRMVRLSLANLQTLFSTAKGINVTPAGSFLPSVRVDDLPAGEREQLGAHCLGGVLMLLEPEAQKTFEERMGGRFCLAGWYGGKNSIGTMVDKNDFFELFNQMLAEGMVTEPVVAPASAAADVAAADADAADAAVPV